MSPTRVASLCSGYGGIELGLELAGVDVEVVWHAEYDDAPALVHGKHWARATLRTSPGQAHPELTGVDEDER